MSCPTRSLISGDIYPLTSRPLLVPFLIRTLGKGTDTATTLELENPGESIFHWEDGPLGPRGRKNAQIGEETCQLSHGTCQNFVSFTIVAVGVTFLKVILNGTKNV